MTATVTPLRAEGVPGIRISDVKVGDRARKDFGDLSSLMDSIREHGLLQPIVLLADDYLLCGERRLKACRQLGWESIPFVRSTTQGDAISRLKAERDENTCRKEMTPTELVFIGRKLEELKRPEAEARRTAGARMGAAITNGTASWSRDQEAQPVHTRREVAEALGLSETLYERAKRVVATAEDETQSDDIRLAAMEAQDQMDSGELTISGADRKVSAAKTPVVRMPEPERAKQIRGLADTGRTSGQIGAEIGIGEDQVRRIAKANGITITADKVMARTHRLKVDANHIVNHLVMSLEGLTEGLDRLDLTTLDDTQKTYWVDSLTTTTRALNRFAKQMKETTQ